MFSFTKCTKDANSPQSGLQYIMLSLGSTADAQTDATFVVSSTNASVVKTASVAANRSQKFLPVTRMVPTEVCANYMGGARVSSPSKRYVWSMVTVNKSAKKQSKR